MKFGIIRSTTSKKIADKIAKILPIEENLQDATHILVIGGDGSLLHAIRKLKSLNLSHKIIYGINNGTIGFLLNHFDESLIAKIPRKIKHAQPVLLKCLEMKATNAKGEVMRGFAFNEIAINRASAQALKMQVIVDGVERIPLLISDGIMVATPQGSTAYNFACNGPILPLHSDILAMTPVSVFRPRRWGGALIPNTSEVIVKILEGNKRPAIVATDALAFNNLVEIRIKQEKESSVHLLFDEDNDLKERIFNEQFMVS